ncbi:MAG: hypothetical protein ACR2QH_01600 [Geminicoccaceae bacterium]
MTLPRFIRAWLIRMFSPKRRKGLSEVTKVACMKAAAKPGNALR